MTTHYTPTHHRLPSRTIPAPRAHPGRRLAAMRAVFAALFLVLAARLVAIQVLDHRHYAALSVSQVREDLTTNALRAGIYDRYGQILAVSRPTSLVLADDFQITHPATEAAALSPLVGVPVGKLTALLSEHNGYVVVNGALNLTAGHRVASLQFPGIVVESSSVRTYPNGPIATSVIGGTNASGAGSAGLEYEYQSMLAGKPGVSRAFVSSGGVSLPSTHTSVVTRAQPGVGLELTVDTSLQFVTERALARQLAAVDGVTGVALVMDVKTGEILADASLVNTRSNPGVLGTTPAWGQSVGVRGVEQTINNLAFSQAYEPGSVFKVVTFSAALQAGDITPYERLHGPQRRDRRRARTSTTPRATAPSGSPRRRSSRTRRTSGPTRSPAASARPGCSPRSQRLGFGQTTRARLPGRVGGAARERRQLVRGDRRRPADRPGRRHDAASRSSTPTTRSPTAACSLSPSWCAATSSADGAVAGPRRRRRASRSRRRSRRRWSRCSSRSSCDGTGTSRDRPGLHHRRQDRDGARSRTRARTAYIPGAYNATFVGFAPANAPVLSMIVVIERPDAHDLRRRRRRAGLPQVMSYALHRYGIASTGADRRAAHRSVAVSISSDVT